MNHLLELSHSNTPLGNPLSNSSYVGGTKDT